MGKLRHILGNILFQGLILTLAALGYMVYRVIFHQDICMAILLVAIELAQTYAPRTQFIIDFVRYFEPIKMFAYQEIIAEEPTEKSNTLYSIHPHGIFNYSTLMNLYTPNTYFENITILASRVALFIPIFGLWMRLFGTESVDSKNLDRLMSQGIPVGIVPGGFEEATLTTPKENRLYLKNRYGFIKYALKYGTTVYPVFNFGENQLFNTFDRFLSLRLWLNQYKIAAALFWSRFGTLPDPRTKLVSVCGKGLKIPKIPNPTKEDVKKYHDLYIKQLTELYEKYSPLYQPNIPLKIY